MRNTNGAAHHVGDGENFKNFVGGNTKFVTFAEVVFDAIIAAQNHGSHEAEHFFGTHIEGTLLVRLVVEAPETFDHFVVVRQDAVVHAGTVVVEFLN